MVDLAKLLKQEPFGSFQSSLGKLWVFKNSVKDQSALSEALPRTLDDTTSEDFVRGFTRFVCFPDGSLTDGKSKPDAPVLTDSDVNRLTNDDLETFAKIYVENNRYLFTKREYKRKKDAEGKYTVTPYLGDVQHPRSDGESYVEYLYRLSLIEQTERREQGEKLRSSFSNFSGGVAESIRNNLAHGDSLRRAMESLRPGLLAHRFHAEPVIPSVDLGGINRNAEEARRAPFDDLARRLDQLVDSSIESSGFMVESNAIQAKVAEELKKSGDSASLFSSKNLRLSIAIIVLTVISLGITAYSTYQGSKQDMAWQNFSEEALNNINGKLQNISEIPSILREYQLLSQEQFADLKTENSMLKTEVDRLQNRVQELEGNVK